METESVVMQIPICTKPGVPNVNGVVYSKECLEKAIEDFKDRKSEGECVFVTDIDYDNFYIKDNEMFDFCNIPTTNILGTVEDYNINTNTIACKVPASNYSFIKSYVENGCRALMRYIGKTDLNNDDVVTVRDMKIISFDLDEKTYNSVRDFYDEVHEQGEK